jgi:hypothetical protein
MPTKPKSYFAIPLRGFVIALLFCFLCLNFVFVRLLDKTEQAYAAVALQIPQLQDDVNRISLLTEEVSGRHPLDAADPRQEFSKNDGQPLDSPKPAAKRFQFVVIDEKNVIPDPSCQECMLDDASAENFAKLLRSKPDTLFMYVTSDDVLKKEKCSAGSTKFSSCILKYINNKFSGNFLCIKKLGPKDAPGFANAQGGRLILANLTMGPREYREVEKNIAESASVGYQPSQSY